MAMEKRNEINRRERFRRLAETHGIYVIFVIVACVFCIFEPRVLHPSQLLELVDRTSWVAVGAAGMTFAICSGGFDLSVPGLMALGASLLTGFLVKSGFSLGLSLFLMFLCVGLLGLLNGLLITRLKLQPFIATLATCLCFHGITQVYTGNTGTTLSSEQYAALSYLGRGFVFGIPVKVLVVLVVYGFMLWLYHKTSFGVKVRAVGSNEQAARTAGVNVEFTLNWVYVTTALMSGLAAVLYVATMGSSSPRAGDNFDLDCITAVVLGGSSLSGGRGRLTGTLVGALFVSFVKMCLNLLSAPEAVRAMVTGLVLILALSFGSLTSTAMNRGGATK